MRAYFLLLIALTISLPGCGDSSAESAARAEQERVERARQQELRLEEETQKLLESSSSDVDDLGAMLANENPNRKLKTEEPVEEPADDQDGSSRKWINASGVILATGEFVSLLEGNVCLQEADGRARRIPLDQLSQADQDYVNTLMPEPAAELLEAEEPAIEDVVGLESEEPAQTVQARQQYGDSGRRKVVIPFDFVSKFDNGRYGGMVGEMVWKKLEREGGFIIPESMIDVRDLCAATGRNVTPDTPLERVAGVVRGDFQADVGIWGSVERVPGHDWDVYDLTIKCVDFSGAEPKVIYQKTGRTQVVSEIPHLYVKEMLDKLYDRKPGEPAPVDQFAEDNWKNNPSLVAGGDFQTGSGGVPNGWESRGGQHREPLGNLVSWITEPNNSNRAIRFTFDKGVGDGYGVMYYSNPFPVDEGAKYRFQCRWRSNGPNVKVFIKCYDEMESQYTPGAQTASRTDRAAAHPGRADYVPETAQLRECYRSQQNLYGPKNTWNVQTEDFTPKHTKYTPKWGKVMLYAYLGAGVVEFDDVVLKQIIPASPSESKKERRHSMESTVTIKEMEENERRGEEARERLRQGKEPTERD